MECSTQQLTVKYKLHAMVYSVIPSYFRINTKATKSIQFGLEKQQPKYSEWLAGLIR